MKNGLMLLVNMAEYVIITISPLWYSRSDLQSGGSILSPMGAC